MTVWWCWSSQLLRGVGCMGEKVDSMITKKRLYFETSTIIHLDAVRIEDFLPILTERGHSLITSDIALLELRDGSETQLLKKHDFLYVYAHAPVFLDGKISYYNRVDAYTDDGSTNSIEAFLQNLLRSVAGSSSVSDPNILFKSAMHELIDSMFQDLTAGADLRLVTQLNRSRNKFLEALEKVREQGNKILTDAQLEATRESSKILGNINPPDIVHKIIKLYPDTKEWLEAILVPFF